MICIFIVVYNKAVHYETISDLFSGGFIGNTLVNYKAASQEGAAFFLYAEFPIFVVSTLQL